MDIKICPHCGQQQPKGSIACWTCGQFTALSDGDSFSGEYTLLDKLPNGYLLGGRYKLDKLVGKGGMAHVYRAVQISMDRFVAIKLIFPHLASEDNIRKRFYREARIQSELRHPNIVHVFDLIDEPGMFGMVMDWVEGDTLSVFLRQQKNILPTEEILRLFLPLLDGMGFAHSKSIVHRDLKPANILLEGRAGQEITKITDFGIARIIETGGERLTSSGINPGTPKYMSPEQIQGIKNIDHRSDIYSLGILLYQLITGQTPFNNDSYASILISHINDPPPPLSEICPNADMRLEKVIQKALAKSPHDRFQSCKEFALALQWCLCSITLAENKNMHTLDIPPITASKEDNRKTISIPVEEMVAQIVQSLQDIDKKQPQLSAQHEPYSEDHKPDTQTPIERMELEPINIVAEFSSDEINAIGKQRNYYMAAIFAILLFVSAGLLFWPNTKQNTEKSPFAPPLNAKHPNNAMLKSSHDQIAVLTQTSPNIHSSTPLHTATHKTTDKIKSTPAKTTNSAKPIAVYMEIDTEPSGASIYIDQKLLGKTPMRIPTIKHHPITFRIQLSGYIEREISWDGKQNRPKQIYYLAPSPF